MKNEATKMQNVHLGNTNQGGISIPAQKRIQINVSWYDCFIVILLCYFNIFNCIKSTYYTHFFCLSDAIEQIGKIYRNDPDIDPSPRWEDYTFLLGDSEISREGVVFGLSGWFMNSNRFYIQVWRPEDRDSTVLEYRLVNQWSVSAERDDLPGEQTVGVAAAV